MIIILNNGGGLFTLQMIIILNKKSLNSYTHTIRKIWLFPLFYYPPIILSFPIIPRTFIPLHTLQHSTSDLKPHSNLSQHVPYKKRLKISVVTLIGNIQPYHNKTLNHNTSQIQLYFALKYKKPHITPNRTR